MASRSLTAFSSYLSTRAITLLERLKKTGLASRNVAHLEKSSYVVSVSAFIFLIFLIVSITNSSLDKGKTPLTPRS